MTATARSKSVIETATPVREQSVQKMILVPQNPLKQIIVQIFNKFGCCQDIRAAQSRAYIPAENCFHSLPISRRSKAPPGVSCIRELCDDDTARNCLYIFLAHAMCTQSS